MDSVYAVKVYRGEGEAVVTANGREYRITLADLEKSGISEGDAVDCIGLDFLENAAEKLSCIKKAFVYLSYRALPVRKLSQKLKTAGFGEQAIEKTIRLLIKKGYLDDDALCVEYAHSLRKVKLFGNSRIRKELYAKGFDSASIDVAMDALEQAESAEDSDCDVYDGETGTERAIKQLLAKKFPSLQAEDRQARAKAVSYLYRMGYSYDDINNAIEALGRE